MNFQEAVEKAESDQAKWAGNTGAVGQGSRALAQRQTLDPRVPRREGR
jgi:hypothetical protein